MQGLETERLTLRYLTAGDVPFILELLNEPAFLHFIGDRGVRTDADACRYISTVLDCYQAHGFGLYLVELKHDATPVGMCGMLKRQTLPAPDLGFAFLSEHWARGYALESAAAVVDDAFGRLRLTRVVAVTAPDNDRSIRLLQKLGFGFVRRIDFPDENTPARLYALSAPERVSPADDAAGARDQPLQRARRTAIFHIAVAARWRSAAAAYLPVEFAADGFVHCANAHQVLTTADRLFAGRRDLLLLTIDAARLSAVIRYENTDGGTELFPHVYGPIETSAVVAVEDLEADVDGGFAPTASLRRALADDQYAGR